MRLTTMCIRSLFTRRARTALCIAGIAFAVLFVITVGGVTSKYISAIREMNVFFANDAVVVAKGSMVIDAFPIGAFLPENTVGRLKNVEGVASAIPLIFVLNQPSGQDSALQLLPSNVTIGIPAGNWSVLVGSTPLRNGDWPSSNSAKQVVVGLSLAQHYNLTVGSTIAVRGVEMQVTGILDINSSLLYRSMIMPLQVAQSIYGYNMLISMVVVTPQAGAKVEEVAQRVETDVPDITALTQSERGETVEPILNEVALWNTGLKTMLFFMSLVLVTTVAMINVSEKRRDFATLHAIGAPANSVFRTVLTETALLGLFGGLIGVSLGVLATVAMVSYYTSIPFSLVSGDAFVLVSPFSMLEGIVSAVIVSAISGVIPAIAATRTNIAQVLRAEY